MRRADRRAGTGRDHLTHRSKLLAQVADLAQEPPHGGLEGLDPSLTFVGHSAPRK
jgi:hypothetical protein